MNEQWYVLRSKPRKERALARYARSENHEVFFPTIPVEPVNPRASHVRPYFPGYLFVHTDLDRVGESTFHWMPLSQGLVHIGGEPAPVAEGIIRALRKQVHQIQEAGGLHKTRLKHGDLILVKEGVFQGYEGIFDVHLSGGERARILLRMVHDRYMPVHVGTRLIEKDDGTLIPGSEDEGREIGCL